MHNNGQIDPLKFRGDTSTQCSLHTRNQATRPDVDAIILKLRYHLKKTKDNLSRIEMRLAIVGVFFLGLNHAYASSILSSLWGRASGNSMQVGAAIYHIPVVEFNTPTILYKPYLGLTYHSIYLTYFKSCDDDNAIGLAIQRTWLNYVNNNHHLSLGYRLGITYGGWCYANGGFTTASNCPGTLPLLPIGQAILNYSYKNIGLELAATGPAVAMSFIYRFPSSTVDVTKVSLG